MKKMVGRKSSFHKLYLIDSDMYNRILPHLNEVDKQEVNDINERNRPYDDDGNDETGAKIEENKVNDISESTPSHENKPETTSTDPNIFKISTLPETEKESSMKIKRFACEICVNKKFTTKQSLKRHNKTFHEKKQFIKGADIYPEVRYPELPPSPLEDYPELPPSPLEEPQSNKLKRRFKENPEDHEKDHPSIKVAKYGHTDPVKNYSEAQDIQEQKGIKRKGPKRATDYMPRKRFHWESF